MTEKSETTEKIIVLSLIFVPPLIALVAILAKMIR